MLTLALLSIVVLFILFVLLKPSLDKLLRIRFCALCASVASTWLWMLVLWLLQYPIDIPLLALLLGESITGIMYRLSYTLKPKKNPLTGLFVILFGTTLAYVIMTGIFETASLWILVPVFVLVLIVSVIQRQPNAPGGRRLLRQLEHCCS